MYPPVLIAKYLTKAQQGRWVFVLAAMIALASCVSTNAAKPAITNASDVCPAAEAIECLTLASLAAHDQIADHSDWILVATELAPTLQALGRSEQSVGLLAQGWQRTAQLSEPAELALAQIRLLDAHAQLKLSGSVERKIASTRAVLKRIENSDQRADLTGKFLLALAHDGQIVQTLSEAHALVAHSDNAASFKARTLGKLAPLLTSLNSTNLTSRTLASITMGLPYYQAVAYADSGRALHQSGQTSEAANLFEKAYALTTTQKDGYFIAGALRQLAVAYHLVGEPQRTARLFTEAQAAALLAPSIQQQARALSRIATASADIGDYEASQKPLQAGHALALTIQDAPLRYWCFYELAGAAAFSGNFALARSLLTQLPSAFEFSGSVLKDATQRDVAWGYARFGRLDAAITLARSIGSVRLRAQSLARILELQTHPKQAAWPRYL